MIEFILTWCRTVVLFVLKDSSVEVCLFEQGFAYLRFSSRSK
jgi:hypothetical protein